MRIMPMLMNIIMIMITIMIKSCGYCYFINDI